MPRTAGIHLEIWVCQGFLFWFCSFLSDPGGGSDGVPLHQKKPLVLNSTSCCLVQRHLLRCPCRARWTVGGAGEAAREGVRGRGPVVFPVICRKETKWEVECAGCLWAGCSATRPASSSLTRAQPRGCQLRGAQLLCRGTGKCSPRDALQSTKKDRVGGGSGCEGPALPRVPTRTACAP